MIKILDDKLKTTNNDNNKYLANIVRRKTSYEK